MSDQQVTDRNCTPRRDLRAELQARQQEGGGGLPPAWKPEVGEILEGQLVCVSSGKTQRGTTCRIYIIRDEASGALVSVWAPYKVLREELEAAQVAVGMRLAICYSGERRSKSGQHFKHFEVIVEGPESGHG